jgi:hypothetical protein
MAAPAANSQVCKKFSKETTLRVASFGWAAAARPPVDSPPVPQSTPRRLYPRQLRRLAVRFWRQGEDRPRQGFTKNVSLTGAFVSTPDPAGRGERVRLELSDAGRSALLYAVVVHSHRVPAELRRFADSAMGLRFLGLDEVVGPFLGEEAQQPGVTREEAGGWVGGGTGAFPDVNYLCAAATIRSVHPPLSRRRRGRGAVGNA